MTQEEHIKILERIIKAHEEQAVVYEKMIALLTARIDELS